MFTYPLYSLSNLESNTHLILTLSDFSQIVDLDEALKGKYQLPINSLIKVIIDSHGIEFAKSFTLKYKEFSHNMDLIINNNSGEPVSQELMIKPPYPIDEPTLKSLEFLNGDLNHELIYISNIVDYLALEMSKHPLVKSYFRKSMITKTKVIFKVDSDSLETLLVSQDPFLSTNFSSSNNFVSNFLNQIKLNDKDAKCVELISQNLNEEIDLSLLEELILGLNKHIDFYVDITTETNTSNANTNEIPKTLDSRTQAYCFSKHYLEKIMFFLNYEDEFYLKQGNINNGYNLGDSKKNSEDEVDEKKPVFSIDFHLPTEEIMFNMYDFFILQRY